MPEEVPEVPDAPEAFYWYEPDEIKAEAKGQRRQPEFPLADEFDLPTYEDDLGTVPEEGFSEVEVRLMERMNEIKDIVDSMEKTEDTL